LPKSQWQPDQVSATGCFTTDYDFKFEDDIRIDQIAGELASRKIWESELIEAERKKNKKLPKLPDLDLVHEIANSGISRVPTTNSEDPEINESLKEN